jgi:hypothetical protein
MYLHKHGQLAQSFNFGVNMGEFIRNLCKKLLSIILYREERFSIIYEELALSVWSWDIFLTWVHRGPLEIK